LRTTTATVGCENHEPGHRGEDPAGHDCRTLKVDLDGVHEQWDINHCRNQDGADEQVHDERRGDAAT
jgi:hypothetical protein